MLKNLYGEKQAALTQPELNAVMGHHERFLTGARGTRARLAMTDLTGLDLSGRKLATADFTGACLVGAKLVRTDLGRASFYCTDLRRADLRHANLASADVRGAALAGADLSFAKLDFADLRVAMMMFVSAAGPSVVNHDGRAKDNNHGVDFTNCSMKKVSFGNAKLDGANFSGAILEGANFKGAKLTDVNFDGAVLTGVDLKELGLPPEAFKGCITDVTPEAHAKLPELSARLDAYEEWVISGGARGAKCVLDGEDLRPLRGIVAKRRLTALSAKNVMAIGIDFSRSELQAANFDGADLRDADFTGADLRGASFRNARLAHARLDKADLRALPLEGRARAVDFTGAIGLSVTIEGALRDPDPLELAIAQ